MAQEWYRTKKKIKKTIGMKWKVCKIGELQTKENKW